MKVILTSKDSGKKIAIEIVDQGYWKVLRLRVIGRDGYCTNTFYTDLEAALRAERRIRIQWVKEGFDNVIFLD